MITQSEFKFYKDPLFLIREYHGKDKTMSQIATEVGCGQTTIKRWMSKLNIPKRQTTKGIHN